MTLTDRRALLARAFTGCAAGAVAAVLFAPAAMAQRNAAAATVTITQAENGGTVTVPPRGTLVLRLPSNETTGYTWQIAPDSGNFLSPIGKPRYEQPKGNAVGAGGVQVFRFRAPAAGADSVLRLGYLRPFEKNTPPVETFSVTVHLGGRGGAGSVTATEAENNGAVQVPAGGTLLVRLPSNRTTGFTWQLAQNDAKRLKPIGQPQYEAPPAGRAGAGGFQVFRFQAAGAAGSEATLQLNYLQPFDKQAKPGKTYTLTVRITDAATK